MSYFPELFSGIKKSGSSLTAPASLAADQQIPLSATGFSLTGAAIGSGQVTLNAGTWVLLAGLYMDRTAGQSSYMYGRWYDVTNANYIGVRGGAWVQSSTNASKFRGVMAWAVVVPGVATVYEMRIESWTGATAGISMVPSSVSYMGEPWYAIMRV